MPVDSWPLMMPMTMRGPSACSPTGAKVPNSHTALPRSTMVGPAFEQIAAEGHAGRAGHLGAQLRERT
jgi:hypothetical protein